MSDDSPTIWTKRGEVKMPADIWETASALVKSFRDLEDQTVIPVDPDDFLRAAIATSLYTEREGWRALRQ